jgi:4-amino-4-deoxy-L-arabinose transferase-like glycosyltransferase
MKHSKTLFIGILLMGLGLRCINLQSRGIIYDDAFSFFLSFQNLPAIIQGTAADTMPPLYYFLLHFWMGLSQSLWWLRLLSVLLNLVSVTILYLLVKFLLGESAGLAAAFIAAISPFQIYHSQDLRMYALLGLCQLSYAFFFSRIWKRSLESEQMAAARLDDPGQGDERKLVRNHRLDWVGLVISGTLAMYSHNLAVFVLVVPDLFLLIRRQWKLLSRLLAAQALIGMLSLPWLWMLPGQIAKIQNAFWTPRPGLVEIIQAVIMFTATLPLPGIWLVIGAIVSIQVALMVIIEGFRSRKKNSGMDLLGAFAILPPVMLFIVSYIMRPVFVPRAFFFSSLAFYGLAGSLVVKNWPKGPGVLIGAGFVLAAFIALPYQYTFNEFPRSPFDQASIFLAQNIQPGDIVVHDDKLSYFPCLYFTRSLPQTFLADEPGSANDTLAVQTQQAMQIYPAVDIQSAVGSHQQVYFVVFRQTIQEYQAAGSGDHPQIAWLKQHYRLETQVAFNDLEIFKFTH